ncbi:TetR/AcrR family transcriptional regulator [uncultured Paraglaciecola sp.]|jgi:AcrR family transcriptional regulator|uniref:TetR/AcrR family transcriptional regulator n=1 Tax=uncultured Paraglaciecola sp. TaxID=1765024 RepID=UPI00260360E1|nr:TetR/AcrR family transcriptional regulator [uncultured Paraglaciecola sp.]
MKKSGQALGNVTRQANKKLRRERIFNLAKRLIAAKGLEDFTISELADEAGVTTPTIHNLFGKKSDIIRELVSNLIEQMQGNVLNPPIDPIENAKFFVDNVVAVFEQDTDFYRAAFMSADQVRLFDPRIPDGLFQRAQQLAVPRKEWYESGLFLGNIEPSTIMKRVHNSNRLGRIDWVSGYIDLNQFRHQVLEGILLVYASDASPELHVRLSEEINGLISL